MQWQLIIEATIETLYQSNVYQYFVSCAWMRLIPRRRNTNIAGSRLFTKPVGLLLADINTSIIVGCFGTENNNPLHYALSREDAAIIVQNGFRSFNSPNSEG